MQSELADIEANNTWSLHHSLRESKILVVVGYTKSSATLMVLLKAIKRY